MHSVGTYIVYGTSGPCRISEITFLDMPGCDRKRKYYVLEPVASKGSTIYSPVDNQKVAIRDVISGADARALMDALGTVEPLVVGNEKFREETYREVMREGSCAALAGMIRTLLQRRRERLAQGRKFTSVDERFLGEALERLCCELGLALDEPRETLEEQIVRELEAAVLP